MTMPYELKGARYKVGEMVCYDGTQFVIKARRLTPVGIVYQLFSKDADPQSHYDVPQAALDPAPKSASGKC